MIRQGDVLLVPVADAREGAPVATLTIMSGLGESGTWHAHVLVGDLVRVAEDIIRVHAARLETQDRDGAVLEARHATVPVPPGTYQVIRQREWLDRVVPALD